MDDNLQVAIVKETGTQEKNSWLQVSSGVAVKRRQPLVQSVFAHTTPTP